MDRLTKRSRDTVHDNGICCTHFRGLECFKVNGNCSAGCPWEEDVWERLAAYEDTGLMPADVEALKLALMGKTLAEVKALNGLTLSRLSKLAEADKDGRVVVLPCKVGDTLYEVTGRKTISEYRVKAIRVELFCVFIEWEIEKGFVGQSPSGITQDEIGKTVFLTREEAEKEVRRARNG